jgi:hypothetical protein
VDNSWRIVNSNIFVSPGAGVHGVESGERGGQVMVLPVSTSVESFDPYCKAKMWKCRVLLIYHDVQTPIFQNQHEEFLQQAWTQCFRKKKNKKKKNSNIVYAAQNTLKFGLSFLTSSTSCGLLLPKFCH